MEHASTVIVGGVTGFAPDVNVGDLMAVSGTVEGIYVGSRADFEDMLVFMEERIGPHVDRIFDFDEAPDAFDFMNNGSFFGKIVIRI